MSTRASRKRRRSQAFPEEETEDPSVSDGDAPKYVESTGQDRLDKEREVWDAFKDEHVEVLDLSSSLWRRFDLVRELDQQDGRTTTSLLAAFMKYVNFRRAIAQPPPIIVPPGETEIAEMETAGTETVEKPESAVQDSEMPLAEGSEIPPVEDSEMPQVGIPPVPNNDTTITSDGPSAFANGASSSSNPLSALPPPPQPSPIEQLNSREVLAGIARLCEKSIRDREEKVNLTLAACDSVERSIRLIDQAIHEQEHAISLGARSGTRLAPILLPELTVPRWTKPARVTLSPDLDDALGGPEDKAPAQPNNRRKKSKKGRKKDPLPNEAVVPLPRPKPPVIPNADPNERRYCYCDQVSFGEMIACDDPRCQREWFHLTCTNLTEAPEGRKKWFCDDCMLRKNQKRNR